MGDADEATIARLLETLVDVSREGLREIKSEVASLRTEFRDSQKGLDNRVKNLEEFMFMSRGALGTVTKLASASFLGAVLSVAVTLYMKG